MRLVHALLGKSALLVLLVGRIEVCPRIENLRVWMALLHHVGISLVLELHLMLLLLLVLLHHQLLLLLLLEHQVVGVLSLSVLSPFFFHLLFRFWGGLGPGVFHLWFLFPQR
jgi:hypothetical protein